MSKEKNLKLVYKERVVNEKVYKNFYLVIDNENGDIWLPIKLAYKEWNALAYNYLLANSSKVE